MQNSTFIVMIKQLVNLIIYEINPSLFNSCLILFYMIDIKNKKNYFEKWKCFLQTQRRTRK